MRMGRGTQYTADTPAFSEGSVTRRLWADSKTASAARTLHAARNGGRRRHQICTALPTTGFDQPVANQRIRTHPPLHHSQDDHHQQRRRSRTPCPPHRHGHFVHQCRCCVNLAADHCACSLRTSDTSRGPMSFPSFARVTAEAGIRTLMVLTSASPTQAPQDALCACPIALASRHCGPHPRGRQDLARRVGLFPATAARFASAAAGLRNCPVMGLHRQTAVTLNRSQRSSTCRALSFSAISLRSPLRL